jgi:hypothetical protein
MFIPNQDYFPIPDPGFKKAPYPGYETFVKQVRSGLGSGWQAMDTDPDLGKL